MKHFASSLPFLVFFVLSLDTAAQVPNWSENVACIIYENCSSCHNANGIAPFSLTSYEDAGLYSNLIKSVISEGIMPPWPPDPHYRPLADERLLSDTEIQTIIDWVDAGAPAGDLDLAPPPPALESQEVITEPDLVVQLPMYTSNAVDQDDYRCFVFPAALLEDRFITGYEVVPGNRSIVHHVLIFQDQGDRTITLDNNDPDPGYVCFGGVKSNSADMIGGWVPGQGANFLPAGLGIKLPADANIVVQLHYPEGSAGKQDNTKINFQLSDRTDLRELNVKFLLNHFTTMDNGPLFIPADRVKTFSQTYKVRTPITIIGAAPHMHLIGRSIKTWAEKPDGSIIPLIDIPEWDFEWQGFYRFQEPVTLPEGSFLRSEAVYDNTAENPHNPNDPPKLVLWGEATTDEMLLVAFTWMAYQDGDEQLPLDPENPPVQYSCNAVTTAVGDVSAAADQLITYPNPVEQSLEILLENAWVGKIQLNLYNPLGQLVKNQLLEKYTAGIQWSIDLRDLTGGLYLLEVSDGKQQLFRKLVKQ